MCSPRPEVTIRVVIIRLDGRMPRADIIMISNAVTLHYKDDPTRTNHDSAKHHRDFPGSRFLFRGTADGRRCWTLRSHTDAFGRFRDWLWAWGGRRQPMVQMNHVANRRHIGQSQGLDTVPEDCPTHPGTASQADMVDVAPNRSHFHCDRSLAGRSDSGQRRAGVNHTGRRSNRCCSQFGIGLEISRSLARKAPDRRGIA